jgi:ribosome-associated protein
MNGDGGRQDEESAGRTSRSARVRDAEALQRLGERLLDLSPSQLESMPLPTPLRAAVERARRLRKGGGLRRERQLIGRLMRETDPEPIRRALAELDAGHRREVELFRTVERLRDRLLEGDSEALAEARRRLAPERHGELDRLLSEAAHQARQGRPPAAARALFRLLREGLMID